MKAYLTPGNDESGAIPIESWVGVYRDPDRNQQIAVERESEVSYFEIADVTVSRKKGSDPPILILSNSEFVEVRNQGNSNGVIVRTEGEEKEVGEGFSEEIRRDAEIEIGYQTKLRLTVEREARVEIQDGDYVAGNKTEVNDSVMNRSNIRADQSKSSSDNNQARGTVKDSVVNRSQVEGGGSVDDSLVNRSSVGGDVPAGDSKKPGEEISQRSKPERSDDKIETQSVCEIHEITYTSDTCPKCVQETDDENDTKFCIYCGEAIPVSARVCSQCGSELPER